MATRCVGMPFDESIDECLIPVLRVPQGKRYGQLSRLKRLASTRLRSLDRARASLLR